MPFDVTTTLILCYAHASIVWRHAIHVFCIQKYYTRFDCMNHEDVTDRLFRNVAYQQPVYAA